MVNQFEKDNLQGLWEWLPIDSAVIEYSARVYLQLQPGLFFAGVGLPSSGHGSMQQSRCNSHARPTPG
jgi:hypothetical protein